MTYDTKVANVIKRLKEVKSKQPGLTIQKIADHTGVSVSTVTRIFSDGSENQSFRYESVRPIAKMLLDLDDLDEGEDDEKALKAIIQFKDTAIEQLKTDIESEKERYEKKLEKERLRQAASIDFLKKQIALKDDRITLLLNAIEDRNAQYNKLYEKYDALLSQLLSRKE